MSVAMKGCLVLLCISVVMPLCHAGTKESLGAYYELVDIRCEVKDNRFRERVVERITIENKRGDNYRWVSIAHSPFARIHSLQATVYDARGKKVYTRKRGDFLRAKGYGASFELYNDLGIYETECLAPSYPYTIEFEYEREHKSLFFWRGTTVQRLLPVDDFSYELKIKDDLSFALRQPESWPAVQPTKDGDWSIYRWEATDIPAFDREDYVPGFVEPEELKFVANEFELDDFEFSGLSWNNVATWYRDLAADRYLPVDSAEAARSTVSELSILKDIYNETVDSNRYVAVSIGLSGWQPASADKTLACGYGDCKGLSTLLISRARQHGIACFPVLVLTRDRGRIDPAFPEFGFNHVIAVAFVDQDTVWMDPTCNVCGFGDLPRMDEDIPVLVITDSGGAIVQTPTSSPDDNLTLCKTILHMDVSGMHTAELSLLVNGNRAQWLKRVIPELDKGEIQSFLASLIGGGAPLKVVDYTVQDNSDRKSDLRIDLVCSLEGGSIKAGECEYTALPLAGGPLGGIAAKLDESPALEYTYPQFILDSISIVVDSALAPESIELPVADSAACPSAESRITSFRRADTLLVTLERKTLSYLLQADDYPAYRDFYKVARKHMGAAITKCASSEPMQ